MTKQNKSLIRRKKNLKKYKIMVNNNNSIKDIKIVDVVKKKKQNKKIITSDSQILNYGSKFIENLHKENAELSVYSLESLYSKDFFKLLQNTIGSGKDFCKLSHESQTEIQNKMFSIFYLEDHHKNYHKRNFNNPDMLLEILNVEFEKFSAIYSKTMLEEATIVDKRIKRRFLCEKLKSYTANLFEYLILNSNIFSEEETKILKQEGFYKITDSLTSDLIFKLLCSSSLKIAYRNILENKKLDNDNPFIPDYDFFEHENPEFLYNENKDGLDSHLKVESHEFSILLQRRLTKFISNEIILLLEKAFEMKYKEKEIELIHEINLLNTQLKSTEKTITELLDQSKIQEQINEKKSLLSEFKLPKDYSSNKLFAITNYLKRNQYMLEAQPWYELIASSSIILLDIFKETVAEKVINKTERNINRQFTTTKIIYLPKGLNKIYSFADHFPYIIEPKDWDDDGYCDEESLSKFIHLGVSNIIYGTKTIQAINISQKKCFRINDNYLNLLEKLSDSANHSIKNLPFNTHAEISNKKRDLTLIKLKLSLSESTHYLMNYILSEEKAVASKSKQKLKTKDIWLKIYKALGLSTLDFFKHKCYLTQVNEFNIMRTKRQIFNTNCETAKIFKDFPLYFKSFTDYRGRMYPSSYLFSRTTGFYKYILSDFESILLTKRGLIRMIESYYFHEKNLFNSFKLYIKNNKNASLEDIHEYFLENQLENISQSKNYLYLKLLEKEIHILKKNNFYTNFLIEVDQKSSASTFLSMLLRNKQLATLSNLQGGIPRDINNFLQEKTREFLNNELILSDNTGKKEIKFKLKDRPDLLLDAQRIITAFENDRKLQKYAFMCYCYNQKSQGRAKQWVDTLSESFTLTKFETSLLWSFSSQYESFLNYCFENFGTQIKAFKKIYEFFNSISGKTTLRLYEEGSVLNWEFFLLKTKTGSRYNPIRNRNENYKRVVPFTLQTSTKEIQELKSYLKNILDNFSNKSTEEQKRLTAEKLRLTKKIKEIEKAQKDLFRKKESSFKPGFIHSLDGTVIRLLILKMYKKHKYIINHLHDSIQLHPNFVDSLYEEIYALYNEMIQVDLLKLFTEEVKSQLNNENLAKFDKLVEKFNALKENIEEDAKLMNPENMYTPE